MRVRAPAADYRHQLIYWDTLRKDFERQPWRTTYELRWTVCYSLSVSHFVFRNMTIDGNMLHVVAACNRDCYSTSLVSSARQGKFACFYWICLVVGKGPVFPCPPGCIYHSQRIPSDNFCINVETSLAMFVTCVNFYL